MITTIYDYVPKLKEKFPFLSEKEIETILFRGFRIFDYALDLGVSITGGIDKGNLNPYFVGILVNLDKVSQNLYGKLIIRKLKFLSRLFKIPWDGYYYVGVTKEQNDLLLLLGDQKVFDSVLAFRFRFWLPILKLKYVWRIKLDSKAFIKKLNNYTTEAKYLYGTNS